MTDRVTVTTWAVSDGTNLLRRKIIAVLHAGEGGGSVDGLLIAKRAEQWTDPDTGIATFELFANDDITPANSYYSFTVDGVDPTVVRHYEIPTGASVDLPDLTQVEPTTPGGFVPDPSTGTDGQVLTTDGQSADWQDATGGGASTTDDVTVPTGTMPGIEASPIAPETDDASAYLTAVDTSLAAISGFVAGAQSDAEAAQAAADAAQADADTAQATADAAAADVLEAYDHLRNEAIERLSTSPRFQVCTPWGGDHDSGAYTTTAPSSFSGGFYWRGVVNAIGITTPPASPSNGDVIYSELFTQTAEGIGNWDVFEVAVQWVYDSGAGIWRPTLFFEWTEVGGTSEAHSLATEGSSSAGGVTYQPWYFPQGTPVEIAVDLDFSNADSKWDLSFWRRTYQNDPDASFDGAEWVRISRAIGSTTSSIKTNSAYPWAFGMGSGEIELFDMSIRNGSSSGTILASPNPADGYAAGDGQPFTDDQGRTWTPGADAHVAVPSSLADGSVTTAKLAADSVTAAKIAADAVGSSEIAAGAVGSSELDDAIERAIGSIVTLGSDRASSSQTLADTTGLSFSVVTGRTYWIDGLLFVTGDNTGDLKLGITVPSGTLKIGAAGIGASSSSVPGATQSDDTITSSGDFVTLGTIVSKEIAVALSGFFTASADGTFQIQHSRNNSTSTATTVVAGSFLKYRST